MESQPNALAVYCFVLRQLRSQAPLQFLAQLGDFHSRHHDKFARQHFPGFVVVRQLARHSAVLAILIPAKATVRNCLRADKLKTAQQRISLRNVEFLTKNGNLHQLFVRTEGLGHNGFHFPRIGRWQRQPPANPLAEDTFRLAPEEVRAHTILRYEFPICYGGKRGPLRALYLKQRDESER